MVDEGKRPKTWRRIGRKESSHSETCIEAMRTREYTEERERESERETDEEGGGKGRERKGGGEGEFGIGVEQRKSLRLFLANRGVMSCFVLGGAKPPFPIRENYGDFLSVCIPVWNVSRYVI